MYRLRGNQLRSKPRSREACVVLFNQTIARNTADMLAEDLEFDSAFAASHIEPFSVRPPWRLQPGWRIPRTGSLLM